MTMIASDESQQDDVTIKDVLLVAISSAPQGEIMVSLEIASGEILNLLFPPAILAKLQSFSATALAVRIGTAPN